MEAPANDAKEIRNSVTMSDYYRVMGRLAALETICHLQRGRNPLVNEELVHHLKDLEKAMNRFPVLRLLSDASPGLLESFQSKIRSYGSPEEQSHG